MHKEYMAHFAPQLSKKIKEYATEVVLLKSRYIFTTREGRKQYGYCTHCNKTFLTSGLKHNQASECLGCKSLCIVKSAGMGRKYMLDDAYFLYYEKSRKDPRVLIARGIYAVRDYREDYINVQTRYTETARYVFKIGSSAMFTSYYDYRNSHYKWEKRREVFSMFDQKSVSNSNFIDRGYDTLKTAIEGTPFQYSTYEKYSPIYTEKILGHYSKYPCIEYLTKLGFKNLVEEKLNGERTYSAVNWRGKNINEVLKLSKDNIKLLKESDFASSFSSFATLKLFQISQNDKSNLTLEEINKLASEIDGADILHDFLNILKLTTLKRADNYISKQLNKNRNPKRYYLKTNVITTWRDYIADCGRLNMDISKDNVLFPRDLYNAHQNTIKQVKIRGNKELDIKLKARARDLDKRYKFSKKGLFIRAASTSGELIEEGKALNHCVGTYAERYAAGDNAILLIRKEDKPDKPYYTVELRKDVVVQVRGKNNCAPNEIIKDFIEEFRQTKLEKKPRRIKVSA